MKAEIRGSTLFVRDGADVREIPLPPSRVREVSAVRVDGERVSVKTRSGRVYTWREYPGIAVAGGGRWVRDVEGGAPWSTLG